MISKLSNNEVDSTGTAVAAGTWAAVGRSKPVARKVADRMAVGHKVVARRVAVRSHRAVGRKAVGSRGSWGLSY